MQMLSALIFIFGIGTAVVFTVKSNREQNLSISSGTTNNELTNTEFLKNTFLGLFGLVIVMELAILFDRMAGNYAGQNWGMLAGIVASMAVGFGVGFLGQKGWG